MNLIRHLVARTADLGRHLGARPRSGEHAPALKKASPSTALSRMLDDKYGYSLSVEARKAIDAKGQPIAWYTYPALEYIDQLDFSSKAVFEWGCGNSSLYWARIAQAVTTVEDDPIWYGMVVRDKPANLKLLFVQDKASYVNSAFAQGGAYDTIVIDGAYRYECAAAAMQSLADGGMIILDNSDWLPETAALLRTHGLLQVDMSGIGPAAVLTWTTSFFFDRRFNFCSKQAAQPRPSLGSVSAPIDPKGSYR